MFNVHATLSDFKSVWYSHEKGLLLLFAMLSKALCCFFVHQVPGLEKTQGQLRIMVLYESFIAFNMQMED